jgi:hypothetical protein
MAQVSVISPVVRVGSVTAVLGTLEAAVSYRATRGLKELV